nr:unnamed protein product [Callosobruchus chinensis]
MTISAEAQVRYLVQWFQEWSELQRSDFLPIMAEKYANRAYVNGIINSMSSVECRDKPMSLFECRVKLFREWFPAWTAEQKENFLTQITNLDTTFGEKLNSELENGVALTNGDSGLEEE